MFLGVHPVHIIDDDSNHQERMQEELAKLLPEITTDIVCVSGVIYCASSIKRVMENNSDIFDSIIPDDELQDSLTYLLHKEPNDKLRRLKTGLLSGFPRSSVNDFCDYYDKFDKLAKYAQKFENMQQKGGFAKYYFPIFSGFKREMVGQLLDAKNVKIQVSAQRAYKFLQGLLGDVDIPLIEYLLRRQFIECRDIGYLGSNQEDDDRRCRVINEAFEISGMNKFLIAYSSE